MCDDEHPWESGGAFHSPATPGISRRDVLRAGVLGGLGLAVSGVLPGTARSAGAAVRAARSGLDGLPAFRTAQHIHARGSEGPASMTAQAAEAAKWVDVMWFTDHDFREAGVGAPTVVHFNSLTGEALTPNPAWHWTRRDTGSSAVRDGGIETVDVSPVDPDPRGALWARAVSAGDAAASVVWYADDTTQRNSMRTPAYGQVWQIEVLLREASPDGWGFVRVGLSYHPSSGGRPDAYYFVEYRFAPGAERTYSIEQLAVTKDVGSDGGGDAGTVTLQPGEQAILGVVTIPQDIGSFVTQELRFTDDIEILFPDLIARDNSIRSLWIGATSRYGAPANAVFDYLRMTRVRGQAQFDDRRAIADELSSRYPQLQMYQGSEVSYGGGHRHWLGGDIVLSDYGGTLKAQGAPTPPNEVVVAQILAAGGMPILNHPFGTNGPKLSDAQAAAKAQTMMQHLLATSAEGGLQGIEVFYRSRAGASLEHHWRLFRLALRNGLVLTATGVSDNHWGRTGSWQSETNHFTTGIYAADRTEAGLLDAQARGRAFSAEIGSYAGQLDLMLDEDVMGQIGVRPERVTRQLTIQADTVPKKAFVEVWQVPVDMGGLTDEPGGVIARLPASAFTGTVATLQVDTTRDAAFAAMVVTSAGKRIAGTNPVWHLTAEPSAWSIPDDRRAG